jgi:hypothetical protein
MMCTSQAESSLKMQTKTFGMILMIVLFQSLPSLLTQSYYVLF